jgi:hypothetical protein
MYFSGVRKKCPHCENTISLVQEMCTACELRHLQAAKAEEQGLVAWAAEGIERFGEYLEAWAAFAAEYPEPEPD